MLLILAALTAALGYSLARRPRLGLDAPQAVALTREGTPRLLIYADLTPKSRRFLLTWTPRLILAAEEGRFGLALKTPDPVLAGWLRCQPDLPTLLWILRTAVPPPPPCQEEGKTAARLTERELAENRLPSLPALFLGRAFVYPQRWRPTLERLLARPPATNGKTPP